MITTYTYDTDKRSTRQPKRNPEATFTYAAASENPPEETVAARVTTCVYAKNRLSYLVLPDGTRSTFTYNREGLPE